MDFIEYLQLSRIQKFNYRLSRLCKTIVKTFLGIILFLPRLIIKIFKFIEKTFTRLTYSFKNGDWGTRCNFFVLGIGNIKQGQVGKGICLIIYQFLFFLYLGLAGISQLIGFVTLGTVQTHERFMEDCVSPIPGVKCTITETVAGDNSAGALLFGIAAIVLVAMFILIWISQNTSILDLQEKKEEGRKIQTFKEELSDYTNSKFHRLLLALPIVGVCIFTILPLIDMILMAFTNYGVRYGSYQALSPTYLFSWTGFERFAELFNSSGMVGKIIGPILVWTIVWAVFATFLNYFFGIMLALVINRKTIKFKKVWRTILVFSIAVPQFVSLLAMSKFLAQNGYLNMILEKLGILSNVVHGSGGINWLGMQNVPYLGSINLARVTIIIVNLWVGIPYTVLNTTGILMNIPTDLYESGKIDGASPFKIFRKITMPYVFFVTAPSLITAFIGNINNFNVIYFLTGGGPATGNLKSGKTDLLITWLYKLTLQDSSYSLAAVIGIISFIICAFIALLMYRNSGSFKKEEEFM